MKRDVFTFREHEKFVGIEDEDRAELAEFARKILKRKDGDLAASSYVGVVTTSRGTVVEILPKIDLGKSPVIDNDENTRVVFLSMLRSWRGFVQELPDSSIRALNRFPMLEVFVHRFLTDLTALVRNGLARCYAPVEENLTCLRGRILFKEHVRSNLINRTRFHVAYDEFNVDRAANRLIHSAMVRLLPRVRNNRNRQILQELLLAFADVPRSENLQADWNNHYVDRSMPHYAPVMFWVRLFLFNQGLATYYGHHRNVSLLFPMEQIF